MVYVNGGLTRLSRGVSIPVPRYAHLMRFRNSSSVVRLANCRYRMICISSSTRSFFDVMAKNSVVLNMTTGTQISSLKNAIIAAAQA